MRLFYKGYIGTASYSQDDGCYVGHIINTRDIVSYEGNNMKELKEDFIECLSWDTRYFNSVRNSFISFKII